MPLPNQAADRQEHAWSWVAVATRVLATAAADCSPAVETAAVQTAVGSSQSNLQGSAVTYTGRHWQTQGSALQTQFVSLQLAQRKKPALAGHDTTAMDQEVEQPLFVAG